LIGKTPFLSKDRVKSYKKITDGKIKFPKDTSREAKSLIQKLLKVNKNKRLGNLFGGIEDIKAHKFYKG
jgi:protein kinase X